jgi:hypothetical protein
MLLLLAEGRQMPLLPIPFLGGAAQQAFYRHRYELEDRLGKELEVVQDTTQVRELVKLAERLADVKVVPKSLTPPRSRPQFFVSYARARPAEADYVETILRRRNMPVFRDESDFGAGHEVPSQIREAIHSASVFVVLWCKEYACSPWCFDEIEIALERHAQNKMNLWILCVDETRIVPRRARSLLYYQVQSREELEGRLVTLLDQLQTAE